MSQQVEVRRERESSRSQPLRVLIADDHILVRAGLRKLLEEISGIEIVGEAGDGLETLRLAQQLHPDVVLLDIAMRGLNGLEITERLSRSDARTRVLILSMHSAEEYVLRALRAGADGYLLKGSEVAELEIALRAVGRGESYLSPAISRRVVEEYVSRTGGDSHPLAVLTLRQREILQLVAEGLTSKEVAQRLGLSYRTVETHRAQIMERLGLQDLPALVRFAVRVGLVSAED